MDEDMDDELLMVTGRGSKAAAGKKRRKADSDDDEPGPVGSKRGKQAAGADSGDSDDMNDDEKEKLAAMNELEREMYLYEREEQLQRARLGKSVLDQTRNRDEQVEVRASSRRPRAQTGTDSAIGKIAAAHAQREAREKKKQQEEEERQEKQQRARSRKRQQEEADEQQELPEDEEEAVATDEDEAADEGSEGSDDDADLADLVAEDEDELQEGSAGTGKQLGARAEVYDEGAGYEEAEENATLEEIHSIQLKRSQLEAWHNEPFFEADLPGCVLRIVPNLGPNAPRSQQPQYMLVRVDSVVQRNSYTFPKAPDRTRKWLHLDDLTGTVFRHQMTLVSNSLITPEEYDKAKKRAHKAGAKFITKGDVQQALDKLQHARSFKYDPQLVKEMLQKKRQAGKMAGGHVQMRTRVEYELRLAQQEKRSEEEIQRLQDELDRLDQQQRMRYEEEEELLAAAVEAEKQKQPVPGARMKGSLGLTLVNRRNRDKNAFKTINAPPGSAVAKAAAASIAGSNTADVFSRRHTQSKVYWATGRSNAAAAAAAKESQQQQLQRTASGATEVELLKGNLKKLDPGELIKVLDLSVDLGSLPTQPVDLVPKRVLGLRWYQTAQKRQQEIVAGRHLISLHEWRQRCEQTRAL